MVGIESGIINRDTGRPPFWHIVLEMLLKIDRSRCRQNAKSPTAGVSANFDESGWCEG
jgi:hypothetical protein